MVAFFQVVQSENIVSGFPICAVRYFINDYYSEPYVYIELATLRASGALLSCVAFIAYGALPFGKDC